MVFCSSQPVLALGAWLKNAACLLDCKGLRISAVHGDLRDAKACLALEDSVRGLLATSSLPPAAIAHDLHPDFYSTQLAQTLAQEWKIPAVGVQHHHAHIGAVMAEHGLKEPVIGLALDGTGLGTDGTAWGGELLWVAPSGYERLGHLWPLALPGGDIAAREPWRMLASALHAMGRGDEIVHRLGSIVGANKAGIIQYILHSRLNCPTSTSTGRWFDAAAAALGLFPQRQQEAEAAIAMEEQARQYLQNHPVDIVWAAKTDFAFESLAHSSAHNSTLDLRPLLSHLLAWPAGPDAVQAAAAWFHLALARALADWAVRAARQTHCGAVCLGGGCFMNAVLLEHVKHRLHAQGLRVYVSQAHSCGDAALAIGQAWVVSHQLNAGFPAPSESLSCA